jgi:hypothetical protein
MGDKGLRFLRRFERFLQPFPGLSSREVGAKTVSDSCGMNHAAVAC